MRAAAVALTLGYDPMALLALDHDHFTIAMAVVAEADKLAQERSRARDNALAEHTASATIKYLARALK